MKKTILVLFCMLMGVIGKTQNLIGAWEGSHISEHGTKLTSILIFTEGYNSNTTYEAETGKFVSTKGGSWKSVGETLIGKIEFDSNNPQAVGSETQYRFSIESNNLNLEGSDITYKRIDDGTPGTLNGAWLMSGRVVDGKSQVRDTSGPRKTMKILSGTRFQWIAYNTETQKFLATGGGTYTTVDGKYTESIRFFSRDDSRVGLELEFNYNLKNDHWHHTGFSTKGNPIDEIWSKRK